MAVYRQIYLTFWQDEFVLSLTPEEKYFYLYLLTNSKTTLCGIYELPRKVIEFETGYNRETVEKLLNKFIEYKKIHVSLITNEIVIHNWLKYNSNRSPTVKSAVESSFKEVKDKSLIPYLYGMDTVSSVTVTGTVTDTVTVTESGEKSPPTPPLKIKAETDIFIDHSFSQPVKDKIAEWLLYKKERRESYKPTGLKSFLTEIENNAKRYSETDIIELISTCMANNWKGIIWEKLKGKENKPQKESSFDMDKFDMLANCVPKVSHNDL